MRAGSSGGLSALAAGVASLILVAFAVFQVVLALGGRLGRFAYGGRQALSDGSLPRRLRISSAAGAIVLLTAVAIAQARAGAMGQEWAESSITAVLCWILTALMVLNTLGNRQSANRVERTYFAGATATLAVCFALLALRI